MVNILFCKIVNVESRRLTKTGPPINITVVNSGRRNFNESIKLRSGGGRAGSRRHGIGSPLDRDFCHKAERRHPGNAHYDVCVVDCESSGECRETVWEKKCGCKGGRPVIKGVMKYRVCSFHKLQCIYVIEL